MLAFCFHSSIRHCHRDTEQDNNSYAKGTIKAAKLWWNHGGCEHSIWRNNSDGKIATSRNWHTPKLHVIQSLRVYHTQEGHYGDLGANRSLQHIFLLKQCSEIKCWDLWKKVTLHVRLVWLHLLYICCFLAYVKGSSKGICNAKRTQIKCNII